MVVMLVLLGLFPYPSASIFLGCLAAMPSRLGTPSLGPGRRLLWHFLLFDSLPV